MSGSFSIVLVVLIVMLSFVATRPESRRTTDNSKGAGASETWKIRPRPAAPGAAKRPIGRVDTLQRLRTDRLDIQTSVGRDFGAPELGDRLWPPIR